MRNECRLEGVPPRDAMNAMDPDDKSSRRTSKLRMNP
jgi:hypothetical protein